MNIDFKVLIDETSKKVTGFVLTAGADEAAQLFCNVFEKALLNKRAEMRLSVAAKKISFVLLGKEEKTAEFPLDPEVLRQIVEKIKQKKRINIISIKSANPGIKIEFLE